MIMSRAQTPQQQPSGAFRVPNSLLQGLTTTTATNLNRLSTFTMTTLIGLCALADPQQPGKEVRCTMAEILRIIDVSQTVAHIVDREWITQEGETRTKRYQSNRFSPDKVRRVNQALLALHQTSVVIRQSASRRKGQCDERNVHILDMFGYSYRVDGRPLDMYNLAGGYTKRNVGTADRPVWKARRYIDGVETDARPTGVLFRLNTELARELEGAPGTIQFTLVARRVFAVLREFHKEPAAMRLLLLTLRQRSASFRRPLRRLITELGFDVAHWDRALESLDAALKKLVELKVVQSYELDPDQDSLEITRSNEWYESPPPIESRTSTELPSLTELPPSTVEEVGLASSKT